MAQLDFEIGLTGIKVTTSTGAEYRLIDRDGALEVRVLEGTLAVLPRGANAVELRAEAW
jgi:hypothetical protein